ncbi:MAG: DUF4129 domain-containing protein [Clostridia bacterium]|nr:DUF4129 domain-containing protein [Clostridia bacterium]
MDRINRILSAAAAALAAALMAGCTAFLAVRALGFEMSWLPVYAVALGSAAVVQIGRQRRLWAAVAFAVLAGGFVLLLADGGADIASLVRDFAAKRGLSSEELAAHAAAGFSLALLASLLLGSLFALAVKSPSSVPMMLMILLWVVICALAANEGLSLWLAVPGLIAGVAAFGMAAAGGREGMRPTLLIPAAAIVLLAMLLVPSGRTTWAPLENAAARIRSVVEDYIRFTEERMAFTINEKGYNRAEMIGDSVVAMLGGPANPSQDAVMEVETSENLLLRGTIKRSYTGYSWIDDQTKARYLYYDFTHSGVRSAVFGTDAGADDPSFAAVQASVEMLSSGTSTLFVPARMAAFEMDLANAVYYNSAGEIFLTRDVEAGDSYAFSTRLPVSDEALIASAAAHQEDADGRYAEMAENYTALPDGIDARVYALAADLTKSAATPVEKALAIQKYLMENCAYTLKGGYPARGEDFVSWFLLEEKQGYCSYFASAMAVLCRMNGIPARYVEGYFVRAEEDGSTTVTGKNAHAWVEIYLNGLGWTPFDPTARAYEAQHGGNDDPGNTGDSLAGEGEEETPFENENPLENAPSPSPDIGSDPGEDNSELGADPTPTPTPDPGEDFAGEADNPTPSPDPNGENTPENHDSSDTSGGDSAEKPDPQPDKNHTWLWVLLAVFILLAICALAYLWGRKRLLASDPLKLCVATRSSQQAALILYRGILTLLLQIGLLPQSGETPEQFAARAVLAMPNPYYEDFVSEVVRSRYSGKPLTRETLEAGRRSYVHFLDNMRPVDRARYHLRRMLRGIGDLESIP